MFRNAGMGGPEKRHGHKKETHDGPRHEHPEHAPHEHHDHRGEGGDHEHAFERALEGIEDAPEGGVVFIGGVTAEENPDNIFKLLDRSHKRQGYGEELKELQESHNFVVITREDIGSTHDIKGATLEAISRARAEHGNKKIVVETPLLLQEVVQEPWEMEGDLWQELLHKHGHEGKEWLEEWLKEHENAGEEDEPHGPKPELVKDRMETSLKKLLDYAQIFGGSFTLGLAADSPATVAFLLYAATGRLDADLFDRVSDQFIDWHDAVGFLYIEQGEIRVKIGNTVIGRRPIPNI